jgi:hypothetical protein
MLVARTGPRMAPKEALMIMHNEQVNVCFRRIEVRSKGQSGRDQPHAPYRFVLLKLSAPWTREGPTASRSVSSGLKHR